MHRVPVAVRENPTEVDRYRRLMGIGEGMGPIFGVVLTSHGREVDDRPEIHAVGTAATLVAAGRYPDGRYDIIVRVCRRFGVRPATTDLSTVFLVAEIDWLQERPGVSPEDD